MVCGLDIQGRSVILSVGVTSLLLNIWTSSAIARSRGRSERIFNNSMISFLSYLYPRQRSNPVERSKRVRTFLAIILI